MIAVLRTARGSFNVTAIYSINSNINTDRIEKLSRTCAPMIGAIKSVF